VLLRRKLFVYFILQLSVADFKLQYCKVIATENSENDESKYGDAQVESNVELAVFWRNLLRCLV
jgi:hypothetical protein